MKRRISIAAMLATLALGAAAQAKDLVVNGGFESTSNGAGQINYDTTALTGWTVPNGGYTFVGNASEFSSGVPNGEYGGDLSLWSTTNGGVDTIVASPAGGNFVGQDGAYQDQPIEQNITGLTAGQKYTIGFYFAGAQQTGYTSATTEQWKVSLGDQTSYTPVLNNVNHGFTGWQHEEVVFTADSGTELLSFLAIGTPTGVPPFSLLDGVTLYQGVGVVPEPATWAMMILGVAGIGAIARRRRALSAAVA